MPGARDAAGLRLEPLPCLFLLAFPSVLGVVHNPQINTKCQVVYFRRVMSCVVAMLSLWYW